MNESNVKAKLDEIAAHMLLGITRDRLPRWYLNFCDAQHLVDAFMDAGWAINQLRADPQWITILRRETVSIQVRTKKPLPNFSLDSSWWSR